MPQLILKAYCEGSSRLAQPLMANINLDIQCLCHPAWNPDMSFFPKPEKSYARRLAPYQIVRQPY